MAALEGARDRALNQRSEIRRAIENGKKAIQEAKRTNSAAVVFAFVSNAMGDPSPTQEAEETILKAESQLAENDRVMDAISREVQIAEQNHERVLSDQRRAVAAVLSTDPATVKLREANERAASLVETVRAIAATIPAIIGPAGIPGGTVNAAAVTAWSAAAASLLTDAALPDAASDPERAVAAE